LVLNGDVTEDGASASVTDTPAEGTLVGDEVVRGVDGETAPAGNEGGDDGEVFDLRRGHGIAVAVEDGLTRCGRADTRQIEAVAAHGLDDANEGVVGCVGEQQERRSRIDNGIGVVAGRVTQGAAVDLEVRQSDDEPFALGHGCPRGVRRRGVTQIQFTTVRRQAHGVHIRDAVLFHDALKRRHAIPARQGAV